MNLQLAVAEHLIYSMFNQDLAVEPPGLPELTPGVHQYLGDLPHELRHVYVAIHQMKAKQFAFEQGTDEAVAEAWRLFKKDLAFCFNQPEGADFEIVAGFKAALLAKSPQPAKEANPETTFNPPPRFCDDMASY